MQTLRYLFLIALLIPCIGKAQSLQQVTGFGSNPGELRMYEYVPSPAPQDAPLVVVLHGCSQDASSFLNDSEWDRLADRYGFHLLFPEQKSGNNNGLCFNWFEPTDHARGSGEALSIDQMVGHMVSNRSVDTNRIFVTGLSAGGAMTAVMMATYPDRYEAGAIMAGLPYKSAENGWDAAQAMDGNVRKTPSDWAQLVEDAYPSYSGSYPRVAIFQGTNDGTVDDTNAHELMEQWTEVQGVNRNVDRTEQAFASSAVTERELYKDSNDETAVSRYTLSGMGHGIAVNPGTELCKGEGGSTGSYSIDVDLWSSYWAARSFDIVPFAKVSGPMAVDQGDQGLLFTTPYVDGSVWNWEVPSGASIVDGQGSDSLTVDWGSQAGYVKVTRTDSNGCTGLTDSAMVGITALEEKEAGALSVSVHPNPSREGFRVELSADLHEARRIHLRDIHGRSHPLPKEQVRPGEDLIFGDELQSGIYFLRIGKETLRLIVP